MDKGDKMHVYVCIYTMGYDSVRYETGTFVETYLSYREKEVRKRKINIVY